MRKQSKVPFVVFGVFATSSCAVAVDWEDLEISASVALTSDYVWRGVSLSANRPAIQGALDFDYTLFESDSFFKDAGIFVGVWASSTDHSVANKLRPIPNVAIIPVDPGADDGPRGVDDGESDAQDSIIDGSNSVEIDIYAGFSGTLDLGMDIGWNVGWLRYQYPGAAEPTGSNFDEVFVGIDLAPTDLISFDFTAYLGVEVDNTIDFGDYYDFNLGFTPLAGLADDDPAAFMQGLTISGHFGYYNVEGSDDEYVDWKVGVAQDVLGVNVELAYWDTDINTEEDPIYMVTFSKSF